MTSIFSFVLDRQYGNYIIQLLSNYPLINFWICFAYKLQMDLYTLQSLQNRDKIFSCINGIISKIMFLNEMYEFEIDQFNSILENIYGTILYQIPVNKLGQQSSNRVKVESLYLVNMLYFTSKIGRFRKIFLEILFKLLHSNYGNLYNTKFRVYKKIYETKDRDCQQSLKNIFQSLKNKENNLEIQNYLPNFEKNKDVEVVQLMTGRKFFGKEQSFIDCLNHSQFCQENVLGMIVQAFESNVEIRPMAFLLLEIIDDGFGEILGLFEQQAPQIYRVLLSFIFSYNFNCNFFFKNLEISEKLLTKIRSVDPNLAQEVVLQ